jgi:hypothetical protein
MDVLGLRSSKVNIRNRLLHNYVCLTVGVEIPMAVAVPALQVEIHTVVVAASSPDPSVGEEDHQANLDTTVVADASSLNPKPATREVHQLREILPTALRVPDYSEKSVTRKRLSHTCLIIKILA